MNGAFFSWVSIQHLLDLGGGNVFMVRFSCNMAISCLSQDLSEKSLDFFGFGFGIFLDHFWKMFRHFSKISYFLLGFFGGLSHGLGHLKEQDVNATDDSTGKKYVNFTV